MRDLTVNAFVTLDGVMQAPGAPEEDPTGGFAYGGWSVPVWDETMNDAMNEACPVIVGKGKRLFGDDLVAASLELVTTKTSSTGVMINTYRRNGPVEIGSFAFEEPTEAERERRERRATS
jgi:hypothetical protein